MTVESATYISQLNPAFPAAGDNISQGDDHLRLIKSVLQSQFTGLATTAVTQTSAQMNKLGFEPGTIVMFASGTTPTTETISGVKDWLICDGSVHSNTTYSALYAVIGTVFGTSSGNVQVPDYRTYFPVGVGTSFVLGTAVSASAAAGTAVLKVQPINFLIKT
jgi:hypothetical protein